MKELTYVADRRIYSVEDAARNALVNNTDMDPATPYLGVWRMPDQTPVYLFSNSSKAKLFTVGWIYLEGAPEKDV